MRCPGSKLANLVRLTADDAHRTDANLAY